VTLSRGNRFGIQHVSPISFPLSDSAARRRVRLYEPGSVRLIRAGDFADGGLTIQPSVTQISFFG